MLIIRFLRVGKKHQPSFKIVVVDKKRAPRSGKFVEEVGFYNPLTKEKIIKKERILYWLSQGVDVSDSVYNLLVREGVVKGPKRPVHSTKVGKKKLEQQPGGEVGKQEQPAEKQDQSTEEQADVSQQQTKEETSAPKEEQEETQEKSVQEETKEEPKEVEGQTEETKNN